MPTCQKCNTVFKNHVLIDGKYRNLNKRNFCLDCSPFGEHNTRNLKLVTKTSKICPSCKELKDEKDFYIRKRGDFSVYCIKCTGKETMMRIKKKKLQAIEYKGSSCQICGYDFCPQALDFHHLNRDEKEYDIARGLRNNSFEKMKAELDKTILLCCRCHREVEAGLISVEGIEPPHRRVEACCT